LHFSVTAPPTPHLYTLSLHDALPIYSPRSAATPAHALLNYLYALLEVEARVACLTVGLDPGLGVLHADLRSRDSLACDVMEAARSEEHTSELQSRGHLVCRLLLEKKK